MDARIFNFSPHRICGIFFLLITLSLITAACKPRQRSQLAEQGPEDINMCTLYDDKLNELIINEFGSQHMSDIDNDMIQLVRARGCVNTILNAQFSRKGILNKETRSYFIGVILPLVQKYKYMRDADDLRVKVGVLFFLDAMMRVKPEENMALDKKAMNEALDVMLARDTYSTFSANPDLACGSVVSCLRFAGNLAILSEQGDLIYENGAQDSFKTLVDEFKKSAQTMVKNKNLAPINNTDVNTLFSYLGDVASERALFRSLQTPTDEGRNLRFSPDAVNNGQVDECFRRLVKLSNISDANWVDPKKPLKLTPEWKRLLSGTIQAELLALSPENFSPMNGNNNRTSFFTPSPNEISFQKSILLGAVMMAHINLIGDQIWYQRVKSPSYAVWQEGINNQLKPQTNGSRPIPATYIWFAMKNMFPSQIQLPIRENFIRLLTTVAKWATIEINAGSDRDYSVITAQTLSEETKKASDTRFLIDTALNKHLRAYVPDEAVAKDLLDNEAELASTYVDFESWAHFLPSLTAAVNNLNKIQQGSLDNLAWVNLASYQLTATERAQMRALAEKDNKEKAREESVIPLTQLHCLKRSRLLKFNPEDDKTYTEKWGLSGTPVCRLPYDWVIGGSRAKEKPISEICDDARAKTGSAQLSRVASNTYEVLTAGRYNVECDHLNQSTNETLLQTIPSITAMVVSAGAGMAISNALTSRIIAMTFLKKATADVFPYAIANHFMSAVVFDVGFGTAYQALGIGGKVFDFEKSIGENATNISLRLIATTINFTGLHGMNLMFGKATQLAGNEAWRVNAIYRTHALTEAAYFTYLPIPLDMGSKLIRDYLEGDRIRVEEVVKEMRKKNSSQQLLWLEHFRDLGHSVLVVVGFRLPEYLKHRKEYLSKLAEARNGKTEKIPEIEKAPPADVVDQQKPSENPPSVESTPSNAAEKTDLEIPKSLGTPLKPGVHVGYDIILRTEETSGSIQFGTSSDFTSFTFATAEAKTNTKDPASSNVALNPYALLGTSPAELLAWKKNNFSPDVVTKILMARELVVSHSWEPYLKSQDPGQRDFAHFVQQYIAQRKPAETLVKDYLSPLSEEKLDELLLEQVILESSGKN